VITLGFAAIWLVASMQLPAPDLPWTAFLPGAAVFAIGLQVLHVLTIYYLSEKLAQQSQLYGGLGVAATALFTLFLLGRGVVWAAELNAVYRDVKLGRCS
jgi:membrane protein